MNATSNPAALKRAAEPRKRARYIMQLTDEQRAAWAQSAALDGRPLAQWIRYVCDREAVRVLSGTAFQ